jgi:radical SAM protein with 4Fe4S-binding SPASM domain
LGVTERIDAITAISPERMAAKAPVPRSVKIELTGRCNFACAFCARSMRLREQRDMDRRLFMRLTVEMREAGVEELGLFYLGESFLVPWLAEAVRFAKHEANYPYVFLTTNGSLATPARVQRCMAAGLDSLKFSLNYADARQFGEVARVKPRLYEAMLGHIRSAWQVRADGGYACGLYASYIQYDGEQADRMAQVVDLIRPYVDEVYALPLYSQANLATADERSLGWKPTAGNRGRLGALRDPLPCWAVFTEGHVTWDGKLSACCFDHNEALVMGDLTRNSFLEAWNSDEFQRLRRAHLNRRVTETACEGCLAYQL